MSTQRREPAKRLKNAEGVTLCSCGCGNIPKPPRQTWFSQACVDRWRSINDPCHKRMTAELAARRAKARRNQLELGV